MFYSELPSEAQDAFVQVGRGLSIAIWGYHEVSVRLSSAYSIYPT